MKNDRERNAISEWAKKGKDCGLFSTPDYSKETYFEKRKDTQCLKKYEFQTLPEIREELEIRWEDSPLKEITNEVAISIVKHKVHITDKVDQGKQNSTGEQLKPFIYNF